MDPITGLGIGLALLGIIRAIAAFTTQGHKEPEPYIPTALEDWDADFERLTGQRVPFGSVGRRSIRGSFNTLLAPGLRKTFNFSKALDPYATEETFDEKNDETVSFHPNLPEPHGPDAEW